MFARRILSAAPIGACALLALTGTASAGTLTMSCQVLSPGGTTTCPGTAPMYTVPGQYGYGDFLSSPDGTETISGSDINGGSAGFIDAYFFQISPSTVDAVSATISDGSTFAVSNLFARLYSLSANPEGLVLGQPVGTVYDGVITQNSPATMVQINPVTLSTGSYVLEISGTVSGTAGGGYTGSLNLTPVPLLSSFPLLLTGLLGFAGLFLARTRDR
jgi:hypothetical protein